MAEETKKNPSNRFWLLIFVNACVGQSAEAKSSAIFNGISKGFSRSRPKKRRQTLHQKLIYEAGRGDGCQRGGSKSVCIKTFRNNKQKKRNLGARVSSAWHSNNNYLMDLRL